ncbi:MAG: FAD-dependent oxidoreductase, partial [Candidatus Colwellbacteria bacterium]|nr:FAD-dependent oxidoreductase [Candidatus Colwellbacteria bacterium]
IEFENGDPLAYSHLVFALGTKVNYFGISGLKQRCFTLKTFSDALAIRDTIIEKIYSTERDRGINIVICGAGSTGVELAAELQEWFAELGREGKKCNIQTTLIDASPSILSRLDKNVIRKAEKRLRKLRVNILTKSPVEKVTRDQIILKGDVRLGYDILIWTGGIEANSLTQTLPFKKDTRGIEVDKHLKAKKLNKHTKLKGEVYVIGDSAVFRDTRNRVPVPQMARPAISEGLVAANNIISNIAGKPEGEFYAIDYPYVVPVGGKYTIVKIGPFVISGLLGWVLKGLIEFWYLISIMPPKHALGIWYKGLLIFIKNDRLG